ILGNAPISPAQGKPCRFAGVTIRDASSTHHGLSCQRPALRLSPIATPSLIALADRQGRAYVPTKHATRRKRYALYRRFRGGCSESQQGCLREACKRGCSVFQATGRYALG